MQQSSKQELFCCPLITFTQNQGFKVNEAAVSKLSLLGESQCCSVVSMVGKSKSGKSYLLNHIIANLTGKSNSVSEWFPVNDGIGTGTQGIWMAALQLHGKTVIVLDMEGLGNLTNNQQNESKLFAITLLLSSLIIYNNTGPLDLQGLQGLGVLVELTKILGNGLGKQSQMELPSLIVALRDFALTLENLEGQPISAHQYLEDALLEQKQISATTSNKNQLKRIIKDIFQQRDCVTLSLPSETIPVSSSSQLRPQFIEQMKQFGCKVRAQLSMHCKSLNGHDLTPNEWLTFVQDIVKNINQNQQQGGSLKLQSLLFQAYRRQQSTIRDKFYIQTQNLLSKAQLKQKQTTSLNQIWGQIDENQLKTTMDRNGIQIQKIKQQLLSLYFNACKQMEQMMRNQSGYSIPSRNVDYNSPAIAQIKDFAELYKIKQASQAAIQLMQQQTEHSLEQQLQKLEVKTSKQAELDKYDKVLQLIGVAQNEREADKQYLDFVQDLKTSGTQLQSTTFEAQLLRLQVAYLRRKLQLSQRQKVHSPVIQKEQGSALKDCPENKSLMTQNYNTAKFEPSSQTPQDNFYTYYSKEVTPFGVVQQRGQTKKSFLVPYLTIPQDQINIQIIRTLVKQDSRGKTFIEYVLQIVIMNKKWTFNRRWKDFNELYNILCQLFPVEMLPDFSPGKLLINDHLLGRKEEIQSRRARLESYIRSLLGISSVRNSRIFQKFVKINKEYVPYL